jgi:hypothetical protein
MSVQHKDQSCNKSISSTLFGLPVTIVTNNFNNSIDFVFDLTKLQFCRAFLSTLGIKLCFSNIKQMLYVVDTNQTGQFELFFRLIPHILNKEQKFNQHKYQGMSDNKYRVNMHLINITEMRLLIAIAIGKGLFKDHKVSEFKYLSEDNEKTVYPAVEYTEALKTMNIPLERLYISGNNDFEFSLNRLHPDIRIISLIQNTLNEEKFLSIIHSYLIRRSGDILNTGDIIRIKYIDRDLIWSDTKLIPDNEAINNLGDKFIDKWFWHNQSMRPDANGLNKNRVAPKPVDTNVTICAISPTSYYDPKVSIMSDKKLFDLLYPPTK